MSPAKAAFKIAVGHFKKRYQQIYMSTDLIVDGKPYRLLGIYPASVLLRMETNFQRFVVVDQAGGLVSDRNLTRRCLRMYQLIVTLDNNMGYLKKNLNADPLSFRPIIQCIERLGNQVRERLGPEAEAIAQIHLDGYKKYLQKSIELGELINTAGKDIMRRLMPIKEGKPLFEQDMSLLDKTMLDFMDNSGKRALVLLESHNSRLETKRLFEKALENQWFNAGEMKSVRSVVALLEHSFQVEQVAIQENRAQTLVQAIEMLKNGMHDFIGKHTDDLLQQKWLLIGYGEEIK